MKLGGHGFRDHLRLLASPFGLIAAVWALRLIMDLAATPPALVRLTSVSVAGAVALLIAVLLIHYRRFGGYSSVVFAAFLLICWEEILIALAIAFAALTGIPNVYVAPEYGGKYPHGQHLAGHLTFGLGLGTLFGAAMGALELWLLRRFVPLAEPRKQIP